MITIDLELAKEIHKDVLRQQRAPTLNNLDVDFIRALEVGDTAEQNRIVQLKQKLRDVTTSPLFDTIVGIVELKSLTIEKILGD